MTTLHYALLWRGSAERPNEIEFLAGGDEQWCWQAAERWTAKVLTAIGAQVLQAELLVPHAYRQFDSTGRLVDADLRRQLERLVAELHTASLVVSDGINETAA